MKILVVLVITVIITGLIACSAPPQQINKPQTPADSNRLRLHVEALTKTSQPRNYLNADALNEAAAYILKEFTSYGFKAEEQKYSVDGAEYKNVIASYGPADAERIIIGAHYDVCGHQDGADDNASGVAGLLELARLVSVLKPQLKYRVDFVAYTLEEPPFFRTENMGSAIHAKSLHAANVKIRAMICLEMIGYFSDEPNSQEYPVPGMKLMYPDKGNFIAVVGRTGQREIVQTISSLIKSGSDLPVETLNAPESVPGIDYSDHQNYWKYDYEAVMITNTSFLRNPNYHQHSDTIETLDFKRMNEVVKGVYNAVVNLK
ncbi:MAG: M28 family peptidase [Bacteroidota bacterium]